MITEYLGLVAVVLGWQVSKLRLGHRATLVAMLAGNEPRLAPEGLLSLPISDLIVLVVFFQSTCGSGDYLQEAVGQNK